MASQAYEIAFSLLKKNPETPWTKVKATCERKGVKIVPVVYGRAKREAAPHLVKKKVKKVAAPTLDFTTATPPPRKKATKKAAAKVTGAPRDRGSANGLMAELGELLERHETRAQSLRTGLVALRNDLDDVLAIILDD